MESPFKTNLRDEKISFAVWLILISINFYLIISPEHNEIKAGDGATMWTVLWFCLATRSYYKIKILQLQYQIIKSTNKSDTPEDERVSKQHLS
jgi:hypothetical protein